MSIRSTFLLCLSVALAGGAWFNSGSGDDEKPKAKAAAKKPAAQATSSSSGKYDPTAVLLKGVSKLKVGKYDFPMWCGSPERNNTPYGKDIPTSWNAETGKNIKWSAKLGSQTYGNPVVANGKVYVGTNNGAGYLARYPANIDLGCLICLDEKTGKFLWQHSSEKLPTGRVHDWPLMGICCSPCVDGNRLWYVTSRGEVCCLDTEGFLDGKNNGPYTSEPNENKDEADVIWKIDMMRDMGISQHNMCSCSITLAGDTLFVCTSNGVDESHINIPAPNAPAFFAMDRNTGKVLWTDNSPGSNILHGQWSSPAYAVLGGQAQVMFAGGDGWLRSFDPNGDGNGKSKLLWKFDCNPKETKWILGGRGTRNEVIATPVVYDGKVYIAVGQDPEHGEGEAHLWCLDPTKRGDISSELAVDKDGKEIPHKRLQAVEKELGEKAIPNPNSGVVWHYDKYDLNKDGEISFEETMHRTIGTCAIKNDLLFIADFSGLVHCLNAKTGIPYWTFDMFAASWGSVMIVEDKVFIGDEDGDVAIFKLSGDRKVAMKLKKKEDPADKDEYEPFAQVNMGNSVYSTAIVANNVLYVANKSMLYAVSPNGKE